ncbi:hypothetical protein ACUSRQ_005071 [Vibrio harveyi]|nr:hypothetical protein [Vibrio harveyi]
MKVGGPEMLISGCIPMFLLFSIQFYLLKFDPKNEYRDMFNSVLPFVPMLKWLTNKPIYFMLGTASVFLGVTIYLAVEGGVAYLAGLIIPVPIFMLTFLLKYASAQIASGEEFTEWTYDNNKSVGTGCATISLACWLYINVLSPSCELWTVFSALSVS